jgi:hypothetical protein
MNALLKSTLVAAALLSASPAIAEPFPATNSERGCAILIGPEANTESCRKMKAGFKQGDPRGEGDDLTVCLLAAAGTYNLLQNRRLYDELPKGPAHAVMLGCAMLLYDHSQEYTDSLLKRFGWID